MSLLMDALKRAERARGGQQDQEEDDASGLSETQGLALDPLEFSAPSESDDELDLTAEHQATTAPGGLAEELEPGSAAAGIGAPEAEGLSLEPRQDVDDTGLFEPASSDGSTSAASPEEGGMPPFGAVDEVGEHTSATLPSVKSARASVDSYFDGTRSISMPLGMVRERVDDDTFTSEQGGFDTGRQRSAASSVLRASGAPRATNWTAMILAPLLVLTILSGAGYVYWDVLMDIFGAGRSIATEKARIASTAIRRTGPASLSEAAATGETAQPVSVTKAAVPASSAPLQPVPVVSGKPTQPSSGARPSEAAAIRSAEPASVTAAASADVAAPAMSQSKLSGAPDVPVSQESEVARAPVPSSGSFSSTPSVVEVVRPDPAAGSAEVAVPVGTAAVLGTPDEGLLKRLSEATDSPAAGGGAGPIRITRKSVPAKVNPLVERGYEALQGGDLQRAQRAYREILRTQPRNRDALLGMAAVAMQEQDWSAAQGLYLRLLELNPRDPLAQAAVISLHSNVDPVQGEAMIKSLLRREPKDAFLHFSLGNLFADQGRWPEAQQAFFDAHRLDSSNADYAFNLAVSLDQLTQPATALDFYRRALELADDGYATFQPDMALARIETLSTGRRQ